MVNGYADVRGDIPIVINLIQDMCNFPVSSSSGTYKYIFLQGKLSSTAALPCLNFLIAFSTHLLMGAGPFIVFKFCIYICLSPLLSSTNCFWPSTQDIYFVYFRMFPSTDIKHLIVSKYTFLICHLFSCAKFYYHSY